MSGEQLSKGAFCISHELLDADVDVLLVLVVVLEVVGGSLVLKVVVVRSGSFPAKKLIGAGSRIEGSRALVPRSCVKGTVYTDAVSFVTASVSMRLRLSFTRSRSSSLSEPGRFGYAFKSGAFSKRYGFNGRVNGETASI